MSLKQGVQLFKFAHRINTSEQLAQVSSNYGIELDLRTEGNALILHHDPFQPGEDFENFLKNYDHSGIILNTKTEGVELRCEELMNKHGIDNFFLLDLSLPFLVKAVRRGQKKVAVRFSEFEPIEFVEQFKGLADWVWVDCFSNWPLDEKAYDRLRPHFKFCMVSPELQGKPVELIAEWKHKLSGMEIDAVCTKRPELW